MISLLNTRPNPQGLTQAIHQAWPSQVNVIDAPLQALECLPVSAPLTWCLADIWVFVSANAVQFFKQQLAKGSNRTLADHQPLLVAVGEATWRALAEQPWPGKKMMPSDADFDSEGILALPEFNQVIGKRIAIVRGEVGRDWLGEQLTSKGAEVIYYAVYRRLTMPLNSLAWQAWLQPKDSSMTNNKMSWVVLTSQENAQIWWRHYQAWLQRNQPVVEIGIIALTPKIAQCLVDLGFHGKLRTCEIASQSSLLKQIAALVAESNEEDTK